MRIGAILVLLGYINTIIGWCSKTEKSKIAFCGIGIIFFISGLIL